jgi:hypothetical protein
LQELKRRCLNRASVIGLVVVVAAAAGLSLAATAGAGTRTAVPAGAITTAPRAGAPAVGAALPVASQTIFSNFGPGRSYDCCSAWDVSEAGTGFLFETANGFTPSAGGQISRIDIALSNLTGTNNATVELAQDSGGLPGAVIRSWSVAGQPPFGSCCAVTTINVSPLIPVGAGHQYWLIAIAGPNVQNDTFDTWNFTYNDANTGPIMQWDGTTWIDRAPNPSGAFDILGCGKLCKVYP